MVYKKYIKRNGNVYGPYEYKSLKKGGKVITQYLGKSKNKKRKSINKLRGIFLFLCILLILGFFFLFSKSFSFTGKSIFGEESFGTFSFVEDGEYLELLVKTSDNILSKKDKSEWTSEMFEEERKANFKQGYIVNVKPEGWTWGDKELDPKRFAIVKIPSSKWNESWLGPEYDYNLPIYDIDNSCFDYCYDIEKITFEECQKNCLVISNYEIKTLRNYRLPLENFLSEAELEELRNIPYNDDSYREPIIKIVNDIEDKIVTVNWENRPEDMVLHGSSGTFTICPVGCNYSTLSDWEGGEQIDLTAGGGTGPCIANITEAFEDTSAFDIFGWTTSATDYIKIVTIPEVRHDGKWNNTAYRLNISDANAIGISESFVYLEGLQITIHDDTVDRFYIDASGGIDAVSHIEINHNILKGHNEAVLDPDAIRITDPDAKAYLYNNLIYNIAEPAFSYGVECGGECWIYSNTFYNNGIGMRCSGTCHVNNTLSSNNTNDDFFDTDAGDFYDYCASSDATANYAGGTGNRINQVFTFVDEDGEDFHLDATDQGALDYGVDLSADVDLSFSDDIDSETRTGTWDIGADEYVVGGDIIPPDINITFPYQNNSNFSNSGLDINFTRSDDTGLFNCWYSNDTYSVNVSLLVTCENVTDVIWSDGKHNVTVWANDTSGNYNSSTISFTIDTLAPDLNITFPYQNNSNSSNINYNVNYTLADAGVGLESCWYSNDTYSVITMLADCSTNITTVTWSEGNHNVTIYANDTLGNTNQSTISFTIDTTSPYFTRIKNISIINNTKWGYDFDAEDAFLDLDCFVVNDTTRFQMNCSGWINVTSLDLGTYYINITINDTVNNLNSTIVRIKAIQINSTNFTGVTTNFSNISDLSNISNLILENPEYGKLSFIENVNLENGTNFNFVNISFNRIEINSTKNFVLNKSSKLYLYNLTFNNPRILRDNVVCPASICTEESYSGGTLVFNVTHFTIYSAEESPVTTISGGTPSGGGLVPSKKAKFTTNYDSYEKTLSINEVDFGRIIIYNPTNYKKNFQIKIYSTNNFIFLEEDNFVIESKDSKEVEFKMVTPNEAGLYTSNFVIISGLEKKEIPFILNVRSGKNLFDITLFIPSEQKIVSPGSTLTGQINLLEMGIKENIDVTLHYVIKDYTGRIYLDESETIAVYDQKELEKEFDTTNLFSGDYVLGIELIYPGGVAVASSQFKVQNELLNFSLDKWILVSILIVGIFILVVLFLVIRRYKNLTKRFKKHKFEIYKK